MEKIRIGKKNVFNNFCIHISSNWPRCTSCHIGYGWRDAEFDFSDANNIDCLVCHDNSGTYKKSPAGAGYPEEGVDLGIVAQSAGPPTRKACGNCHFFGGGGENVKHGDLEPALINPRTDLDVHMGANNMKCQNCHIAEGHQVQGALLSVNIDAGGRQLLCTDCHGEVQHQDEIIEQHTERIACQTCHIPFYSNELPTKIYWDWSVAGEERTIETDRFGKPLYNKMKGQFEWNKNIKPLYLWYNNRSNRYLLGDKIDSEKILRLNYPVGDMNDPQSKIFPFKLHRGKQIADATYHYLIVPQLYGGRWKHYDWDLASREGMQSVKLPYSGKYEFIGTEMYWKVNHEVVEGDRALTCRDCHAEQGRMNWQYLGYEENPAPLERNIILSQTISSRVRIHSISAAYRPSAFAARSRSSDRIYRR